MAVNMENVIRNKRKEKGISQEELAKRCGVSRQTINAIENDKYDPTLSLAFRLARELGLTESAVRTRTFRGRKLLIDTLKKEGYLDERATV